MTRVAAIDCGTNSVRLLVADVDNAGNVIDLTRELVIVRLGEGVDRTGMLAPQALSRTFAAFGDFAARIRDYGVPPGRVRLVATSATRDAGNRDEFVAGCLATLGVAPDVVTGDEEARLSFAGATAGLAAAGVEPPYAVIDIGGGSTEFVVGTTTAEQARSIDIGCVRLTERCLVSDPPAPAEVAAAEDVVAAALDLVDATVDVRRARALVGVAGTVTTLSALELGLPAYDPVAIHHSRLGAEAIERLAGRLLAMPSAGRAALPTMVPGRADVIAAGALVLRAIVRRYGVPEVVVSEHDILDGIALGIAARPG